MSLENISLFTGLRAKMQYLDRRHGVLAQNVANSDTPNYQERDLKSPDFSRLLSGISRNRAAGALADVQMAAATSGSDNGLALKSRTKERLKTEIVETEYEVNPSGNHISIEEQMVKLNKNSMDYQLMTNLYRKNVGFIKTALGTN